MIGLEAAVALPDRLRILMTIHHALDENAGAAGATLRLVTQYERAGHDVSVLSFDDLPRRVPERLQPLLFPAFVASRVRPNPQDRLVDVVDASSGDSALISGSSPLLARTLIVARSHGLEHAAHQSAQAESASGMDSLSWRYALYGGGYRLREVARAMRRADVNVMLNSSDRNFAAERLGVGPARLRVVSNGVSDELLANAASTEQACLRAREPVRRIVLIGSYIRRKGVVYAATALRELLDRYDDLAVCFIGTGCPADRVLLDFESRWQSRVTVVPRYVNAQLPSLLRPGDVHLFPTLCDGFGLTLLEAMACAVPSVTTATSGPTEFARSDENALIVPPRDPAAIVSAVERLRGSAQLRQALAVGGLRTARERTWTRAAAENLSLYRDHLSLKLQRSAEHGAGRPFRQGGNRPQLVRAGRRTSSPVVTRGGGKLR